MPTRQINAIHGVVVQGTCFYKNASLYRVTSATICGGSVFQSSVPGIRGDRNLVAPLGGLGSQRYTTGTGVFKQLTWI